MRRGKRILRCRGGGRHEKYARTDCVFVLCFIAILDQNEGGVCLCIVVLCTVYMYVCIRLYGVGLVDVRTYGVPVMIDCPAALLLFLD